MKENKHAHVIFMVIVGVVFYMMNYLTPEYLDDYLYKYMFFPGETPDLSTPIQSLLDIFKSQYYHYFSFNGRIVVHFFVQLFDGLTGKDTYNIFNTLVFCCFIHLITKITFKRIELASLITVTTVIVIFMPSFNDTFLWMTGSINYLWTATAVTFFISLLQICSEKETKWYHLFLFVPGILIGWTHEGIVFPLLFSLIIWGVLNVKRIYSKAIIPLIIGFIIGACLCAFSPATLGRASLQSGLSMSILAGKLVTGILLLAKLRAIYLFVVLFLVGKYLRKIDFKGFIKENILLFGAIIFSFGIVFLSGFSSSRTAFGLELFSCVLSLRLLSYFINRRSKFIIPVVSTIQLFFTCGILYYSFMNYRESESIFSQIKNSSTSIIKTNEVRIPAMFSQYTRKPLREENSEYYESFSYKSWENEDIAITYGKDSLAFIPKRFFTILSEDPHVYDDFNLSLNIPFYCKRVADENVKEVKYILEPTDFDSLPFYMKPFANKMERYTTNEVGCEKYDFITVYGEKFLLVARNSNIEERIKDIEIDY